MHLAAPPDARRVRSDGHELLPAAPPDVQRQLSAALSIISTSDFPAKWQNLLPELIAKFTAQASRDYPTVNGVLLTTNSIMKRFRYVFKSDELFSELNQFLPEGHTLTRRHCYFKGKFTRK